MPASKITRVTQLPFGTSGPTGDFGAFGSKAVNPSSPIFTQNPVTIQSLPPFLDGWGQAIIGNYEPALEDMNGLFLLAFYQIGYILQMGMPEYDSATVYFQYSRCQYNGVSYVSLVNSNQGNEPDISPTQWQASSANVFGGNVASASSITLPNIGSSFKITGTTTINNISIQTAGITIELIFTGTIIVNTGGNILLNQGPFNAVANNTLMLISDGTNWFEVSRSPSSGAGTLSTGYSTGTPYLAVTDVWVTATCQQTTNGNGSYIQLNQGPTSALGTQVDYAGNGNSNVNAFYYSVKFLIKKGLYWGVSVSGLMGAVTINVVPSGS